MGAGAKNKSVRGGYVNMKNDVKSLPPDEHVQPRARRRQQTLIWTIVVRIVVTYM